MIGAELGTRTESTEKAMALWRVRTTGKMLELIGVILKGKAKQSPKNVAAAYLEVADMLTELAKELEL